MVSVSRNLLEVSVSKNHLSLRELTVSSNVLVGPDHELREFAQVHKKTLDLSKHSSFFEIQPKIPPTDIFIFSRCSKQCLDLEVPGEITAIKNMPEVPCTKTMSCFEVSGPAERYIHSFPPTERYAVSRCTKQGFILEVPLEIMPVETHTRSGPSKPFLDISFRGASNHGLIDSF